MATFRSFWHNGPLSAYENLCLSSFIKYGHQFHLYSFDKITVPTGVQLKDASDILSEDHFFTYSDWPDSPSAFSNLFRYELLLRHGDWWVDTDVICLTDGPPAQDIVFAYQDTRDINGAILKIPAGHDLAFDLAAEARILGKNLTWGQLGPRLITRVVKKKSMEKYCVPTEMFYPLNWDEALHFLLPERNEFIKKKCVNAAFVHLWNEGLRRQAVRKDLYPPEGSFLSDQFKRHGITFPSGLSYTEREIQFMNGNSFIARHRMELERNSALQAYESCKRALESVRAEGHQKIDNSINNTLSVKFDALDATLKAIAQGVPTNTSLSAKVDELCQAFHEIRRQIAEIHEVTSWHRKALRPVRWLWKQLLPIRQKIAQARIRSRQERAMED